MHSTLLKKRLTAKAGYLKMVEKAGFKWSALSIKEKMILQKCLPCPSLSSKKLPLKYTKFTKINLELSI